MRKVFYVSALVALAFFAVACGLYALNTSRELVVLERQNADFVLQSKCSEDAARFYKSEEPYYKPDSSLKDPMLGVTVTYISHWNKRLRKCFIQISSEVVSFNILAIDIFDAQDRKRYAQFDGHLNCNTGTAYTSECTTDSGVIWLAGDNSSLRFDGGNHERTGGYNVGRGSSKGRAGDAHTKDEFLKYAHPLMND